MNNIGQLQEVGLLMNKSDLIEIVSQKANVPKKKAEEVVHLIFDTMSETLIKGDRIEIRGLGSFTVKEYGAYTGRNPRTGESIQVRPKRLPFFKVGKELRERVDGMKDPTPSGGSGAGGI
jgi:integration host factor subunit beta